MWIGIIGVIGAWIGARRYGGSFGKDKDKEISEGK